jgi:hypothetical protein
MSDVQTESGDSGEKGGGGELNTALPGDPYSAHFPSRRTRHAW